MIWNRPDVCFRDLNVAHYGKGVNLWGFCIHFNVKPLFTYKQSVSLQNFPQ